jgi:hypothetical protein
VRDLSALSIDKWRAYTEKQSDDLDDPFLIAKAPEVTIVFSNVAEGIVAAGTGLEAVLSLLKIELMCGAEYRYCAREDCPNGIFRIESRHPKIYCSHECGHLVAVRKSRRKSKSRKA